jgi:hypothetical protein
MTQQRYVRATWGAFLFILSATALSQGASTQPMSAPQSQAAGSVPNKSVAVRPSVQPVDLRDGPHLFIDEYLIAEAHGVKKVTQHPQRFLSGPILGWKDHTTQPYVTVINDPQSKQFRLWYNYDSGVDTAIAYAESPDGVHWTLPKLNILGPDNRLFKIGRSKDHGSYGVSVIDDGPRERDPARRFKVMWWSGTTEPPGASVAFSPDGLHWTPYENNPVVPYYPGDHPKAAAGVGDIVDCYFDPIRGRYGAMLKLQGNKSDGWAPGPRAGNSFRRLVGASVSDDFVHWAEPWRIIVPEKRDEGRLEFYCAGGTIARGPLLISFVRMLHDDYSPDPGVTDSKGVTPGIGYTTLATSRDGEHWERHDDIFFDRNPEKGTWDHAMTWIGSAVPVGEELYLYYGGYARGHKVEPSKERQLGLTKIRMDRFVAREAAADKPGTIRTVPLRVRAGKGSQFILNADVAPGGRIRMQVRNLNNDILPGFSFDDCAPLIGDGIALPVRWLINQNGQMKPAAGMDLTRLDNQTVRIEFELTNAKLYGFDVQRGQEHALRLDDGPHLFVDEHLIAGSDQLHRVVQPPARSDRPVMGIEQHPDGHVGPAHLMYDGAGRKFCLWYYSRGKEVKSELRYLESDDPSKWVGQGERVLAYPGDAGNVVVDDDPARDPKRRFKLAGFLDRPLMGPSVWFSPDGKTWTPYPGNPVLPYYPFPHPRWRQSASDILDPYWDPIRGQYSMLVKLYSDGEAEFGMNSRTAPGQIGVRLTGISLSDDFVHWTQPERAFAPDFRDEGVLEHYGGCVIARGDLLIAFMRILKDYEGAEGQGYTVLATSRDGQTWTRDRQPILRQNPSPGRFDAAFAWAKTALVKDDKAYVLYAGYDQGHKTGHRQIGLATWPRDRFVARQARQGETAKLRTPLLSGVRGAPRGLWLNANASGGQLAVRVLDADDEPLVDFDTSQPLNADGLSLPVQWKKSLSALGDQPFRLEFVIRDASIFGFSFQPQAAAASTDAQAASDHSRSNEGQRQ